MTFSLGSGTLDIESLEKPLTMTTERILIIHHLEPMWEDGYRNHGTSFEILKEDFTFHLEENHYDKVILTRFEDFDMSYSEYDQLVDCVDQVETYDYGWYLDMLDVEDLDELQRLSKYPEVYQAEDCSLWTSGGIHSEIVWVAEWMLELVDKEVYISGAFRGECMEDLEIALEALGVRYKRLDELIVG